MTLLGKVAKNQPPTQQNFARVKDGNTENMSRTIMKEIPANSQLKSGKTSKLQTFLELYIGPSDIPAN